MDLFWGGHNSTYDTCAFSMTLNHVASCFSGHIADAGPTSFSLTPACHTSHALCFGVRCHSPSMPKSPKGEWFLILGTFNPEHIFYLFSYQGVLKIVSKIFVDCWLYQSSYAFFPFPRACMGPVLPFPLG